MYISRRIEMIIAVIFAIIVSCFLFVVINMISDCSLAYACDRVCIVSNAIKQLQPSIDTDRANKLSLIFVDAGEETDIDPLLLVAIAMRESSFRSEIERLEVLGLSRGERGLMQIHGAALNVRPEGCPRTLEGASCQIRTGARWLQYVREVCPGPTHRWVSAYGRSKCPTVNDSQMDSDVIIAANYYSTIGGENW